MTYIPRYSRDRMKKRKGQQNNTTIHYKFPAPGIVQYLKHERSVAKGLIEDITEYLDTVDLTDLKQVDVHVFDSQGLVSKLAIRPGENNEYY